MKRKASCSFSQQQSPNSNETSKHFKSALDTIPTIPSLHNTPDMDKMTRKIVCQGVVERGEADIFNETIIQSFSVNYSSSPLDGISLYSQEDPSESHNNLDYLLQKPNDKVGPQDIDEKYFKKKDSSSEDDPDTFLSPSQPSTPKVPRKHVKISLKDRFKRFVGHTSPFKATAKRKRKKTVDSLVVYSESSSSSDSSSESSDNAYEIAKDPPCATSVKSWNVYNVPLPKKPDGTWTLAAQQSAQPVKRQYITTLNPSSSGDTSSSDAHSSAGSWFPAQRWHAASEYVGCIQRSPYPSFGVQTPIQAISPQLIQYPSPRFQSPNLCNASPQRTFLYPSTRRKSIIADYDIDEFHSVDNLRFIDSHCHLDFLFRKLGFKGTMSKYQIVNGDTFPKSYEGCIAVFCDPQTFVKKETWEYLLEERNVWGAFGCHPKMASGYNDDVENHLLAALQVDNVRALGEIGLDYSTYNTSDVDVQKTVFRRQLKIAVDYQLPLVIHSRDANADTLQILKEMVPTNHLIHRHCFTGTWQEAKEWLNLFPNLYIGLTPLVTFPNAKEVHDTARNIPLDRLLLETDAPYFVPKKLQARCSHPGMAIHVAAQIAAMRFLDVSLADVLRATRKNTKKVYGI